MEKEICQVKQELTEYLEIDIDLHTREDHALLCKERKDLIYEAFKPPIHTAISTDELSTILGSYIEREQENITETYSSAKQ